MASMLRLRDNHAVCTFSCHFRPFECRPNRSVWNSQPISETAHRLDVTAAAAELIAQAAHVGVYGSGINDRVVSPNITQQPIPPLTPSFALHQQAQELKLGRGAFDDPICGF